MIAVVAYGDYPEECFVAEFFDLTETEVLVGLTKRLENTFPKQMDSLLYTPSVFSDEPYKAHPYWSYGAKELGVLEHRYTYIDGNLNGHKSKDSFYLYEISPKKEF